MPDHSRGVIVLGMHRSGTSALAHLLVALGFEVPGELVAPDEGNPAGHWEPRNIVEIHNQFLFSVGRTWSDPSPMDGEFGGEAAERARRDLRDVFEGHVTSYDRWVVKDPRMCRLLPLWDEILDEHAGAIRFLTVVRSPLSVVSSLEARDGFGGSKSLVLWLRHYLEAEAATRSRARRRLVFGQVVDSPQSGEVVDALRAVTANPELTAQMVRDALDEVLDRSLIHHGHAVDPDDETIDCHPWVRQAWKSLTLLDTDGEEAARQALDEIRDRMRDATQLFGDAATQIAEAHGERYLRLSAEIEAFRHAVNTQRAEIRAQRNELRVVRDVLVQDLSRVEERHLALLDKSLDTTTRIDDELAVTRHQLTSSKETIGQQQERIRSLQADLADVELLLHEEVSGLRAEVAQATTERDVINAEIERLQNHGGSGRLLATGRRVLGRLRETRTHA